MFSCLRGFSEGFTDGDGGPKEEPEEGHGGVTEGEMGQAIGHFPKKKRKDRKR